MNLLPETLMCWRLFVSTLDSILTAALMVSTLVLDAQSPRSRGSSSSPPAAPSPAPRNRRRQPATSREQSRWTC